MGAPLPRWNWIPPIVMSYLIGRIQAATNVYSERWVGSRALHSLATSLKAEHHDWTHSCTL
eukprot:1828222-Rhodomonas_salina.1